MKEFLQRLKSVCGRVKLMATGSQRGSSADAALRWKKIMQAVGFAGHMTEQTFVSSKCQVVNVEECVTHAVFQSFAEDGINPVTLYTGHTIVKPKDNDKTSTNAL